MRVGEPLRLGPAASPGQVPGEGPSSSSLPLSYRWRKDGFELDGEAGPFLSRPAAADGDEGSYSRESVRGGLVVGRLDAEIRVSEAPLVRNNAGYYKVREGTKFVLSVSASGLPPPDFQWRLNGFDILAGTMQNYVVQAMARNDAGTYTCVVFNVAGSVLWEEAIVQVVEGAN